LRQPSYWQTYALLLGVWDGNSGELSEFLTLASLKGSTWQPFCKGPIDGG
jgi:hypothetical protein